MYKGLGLLNADPTIELKPEPRLHLLLELEPRYRIFFRNLFDMLLFRTVPRITITWKPAKWDAIFIPTGLPWWALVESLFWHLLVVVTVVALTPQFLARRQVLLQRPSLVKSDVLYYSPSRTFSTAESARPRPESKFEKQAGSGRSALSVVREQLRRSMAAPDVKMANSRLPNLGEADPTLPAPPSSAISRSQLTLPADFASAIAPPPEVGARGPGRRGMAKPAIAAVAPPAAIPGSVRRARNLGMGPATVVAPAPRLPLSAGRAARGLPRAGLGGRGISVVPPPPSVNRAGVGGSGVASTLSGGRSLVVPPPPSLQGAAGADGRGPGQSLTNTPYAVVAPPPSLKGAGGAGGSMRGGQGVLSGTGVQVVPPPPSLAGTGGSARTGRGGSLSGGGLQVVPPPPLFGGAGSSAGGGRPDWLVRGSSLFGGVQAVPPPPSLNAAAGTGAAGRGRGRSGVTGRALTGSGLQAVPPPPSLAGTGGFGAGGSTSGRSSLAGSSGRSSSGKSLSGSGATQAVPPPVQTASISEPSGRPIAADIPPTPAAPPPPQTLDDTRNSPPVELPIRVIGIAFALPGSSYFSNYEVFIAERRVGKDQTELIKLVYVFLPYQRRLSEIGFDNAGVHKLRVIRDHSCDETLLQMTWRPGQPRPTAQDLAKNAAEHPGEQGAPLPCYRTTADDYRKAMSHSR